MPDPLPAAPRGTRPDAESAGSLRLVKCVALLRPTYQVRLLAFKAASSNRRLVLQVPSHCRFDPALERLIRARPGLIVREELP